MLFNKQILSTLIASILLVSCAVSKKTPPKVSYDDHKGYYKVGNPYQIDGTWYYPKEQPDYDETGISSWYGDEFHGKPTANGDTFDKNSLTAAHNTLPLPSMVRVTNLENNKTIILMVNDRGPFAKGRVIDVSERAADILGFREKGIAKVRVQFLKGQTNRLLAGIKKSPLSQTPLEEEQSRFSSLFKSSEPKSPYAIDDEEYEMKEEENTPFSLSVDKNSILEPVKKLSNMLTKSPAVTPSSSGDLPEIQINDSKPSEEYYKLSENNRNVAEKELDAIEEDVDVEAVGTWQGDIDDSEIEGTIESVTKQVLKSEPDYKKPMMHDDNVRQLPETEQHFVQAGTYSDVANAYRIEKRLMPLGDVIVAPVSVAGRQLYRVRLGPIPSEKVAKLALQKVVDLGHPDAMIVKELPSIQ